MASINYAAREISVKIVYYGPGLSGKTTNLQVIHRKVPPEYKSDMVSLATETDRTLFFDFLPLDLGKIKGFSTKFQLYTVPGQVYYNATRKLVLRGVDGVVFVADSAPDKIQENIESFQNLEENLSEYGYKRETLPIIIQYNKRDLPNALSIDELQRTCNKYNLAWTEAVANKGIGVFDSLKLIGKIVIDYLNKKYSRAPKAAPEYQAPTQTSQPMNQSRMTQPPRQQFTPQPQQSFAPPPVQQPNQQQMGVRQQYTHPQPRNFQQQPPLRSSVQRPQNSQSQMPPKQMQQQRPQVLPQQPAAQSYGQQGYTNQSAQQPPFRQGSRQIGNQQNPPMRNSAYNHQQSSIPQYDRQHTSQQQLNDDVETFEQAPVSHEQDIFEVNSPAAANGYDEYYNYGSINLQQQSQPVEEPIEEHPAELELMQQESTEYSNNDYANPPQSYDMSNKSDLDLEIEKYQKEIEEKQRRMRSQSGSQSQSQNPQYGAPQQGQRGSYPQQTQQPSPQQQQIYRPQQPRQQQAYSQSQVEENDYDVYNIEMSSYPQQQDQSSAQQFQQPVVPADENDESMYFTSIDTDHQKRPIKRPVNPRMKQQQKGFLSKFFTKDDEETP